MRDNLFPINLKEADITRQIRQYLKIRRVWHWKNHGGLGGKKGVADILGQFRGRFLAIEVKTAKGRLSDEQRVFLEEARREGGIAFVARSVDDVERGLGFTSGEMGGGSHEVSSLRRADDQREVSGPERG